MNELRADTLLVGTIMLLASGGIFAQTPQTTAPGLGGTSWRLVKFQGSDDKTLTLDDGNKYTLEFGADGNLSARIDCNRGRGKWQSSGPNQLQLGPLALTRAMCPPGSLHDRIAKDLGFVRSYVMKGAGRSNSQLVYLIVVRSTGSIRRTGVGLSRSSVTR